MVSIEFCFFNIYILSKEYNIFLVIANNNFITNNNLSCNYF